MGLCVNSGHPAPEQPACDSSCTADDRPSHKLEPFVSSHKFYFVTTSIPPSHLYLPLQVMGRGVIYYIFQRPRFCCCLPVRMGVIIMSFLGIILSGLLSIVCWFEVSRAYVPLIA